MQGLAALPSGQVPIIVRYAAETLIPFVVAQNSAEPAAICIAELATSCLQHVRVTGPQADTLASAAISALQVFSSDLAQEVRSRAHEASNCLTTDPPAAILSCSLVYLLMCSCKARKHVPEQPSGCTPIPITLVSHT